MQAKNLSKSSSFKGKINGQRLPPIPITNEQSIPTTTTTNGDLPNSILKKSKPLIEDRIINNRNLSFDDDDPETSRVIFQKSPADVLLLLDTYPPKTWTVPKCLKSSYNNILDQARALPNPIFGTLFSSDNQNGDLVDAFPSPLSDRLPSSRYCRPSVSSACSRRSSILFHRQSGIPVDSTQLQREESFDTLCESLTEAVRSSYTPLPPIPTNSSSNLTKSLIVSTTDLPTDPSANLSKSLIISTADLPPEPTDPSANLKKSLIIPSKDVLPSVSPPLITAEETPAIQEKKEEFTRRLLSKSLHRESNISPKGKTMNSPTAVHKTPTVKPVAAPRIQKPAVDNRRVNSVERHPVVVPVRNKIPTTSSCTSINSTNHQRLGKIPLDIFQPQPKCNTTCPVTNKNPTVTNNKTKISTKINVPKVKVSSTVPDKQMTQSNNDVIPPPSALSASIETSQVTNTVKPEELPSPPVNVEPVPPKTEELKLNIPTEPKHHPSSRGCNSHYSHRSSHPVPKPLTLQGEKIVEADYPQTTTRTTAPALGCSQRRGSLTGQPLITELFPDSTIETQKPIVKPPEPIPPTRPSTVKPKKQKPCFLKCTKPKTTIVINKPKISTKAVGKIETKCQSRNTEIKEEQKTNENMIVIGGTDWMMTVKPQVITNEKCVLSQLFEPSTVDDEDLPSCASPTDHLAVSQSTLMTSIGDTKRRNSSESDLTIDISPVLTQVIEHPMEPIPETSLLAPKPTEPSLINSDIRAVYETVKDSIRKDTSLRSLPLQSNEQEVVPVKPSSTTTSTPSETKTLPFEASVSVTQTYNNSDTGLSMRPPLRVVSDSLNSRGSETIDSISSQEDFSTAPLCAENDCDEIYRTARKGRQVGRGAYGIVWSYLTITGRMIAVKEIELDENDSERVRNDYESVREEINILRALNHPYVVRFLGISLENRRLVKIFMEYLPNGTIENLLTAFGPFHNDVLKKYTRQIVEGVSYLHANNVVHRDIKGKNIMLDVDGNIKLIDFGCAKRLKKNQNTHSMRQILKSMKGTANWMAPEVIAETGHGKKADIWSIGCTLCEMATGKPPWSSEHNHLAVLLIIANGTKPPADLPDTCPVTAQEFFRLCLTRDPSARPSARDLLNHPFLTS